MWLALSELTTLGSQQSGLWKFLQVLSGIRMAYKLDIKFWQAGFDFCGFENYPIAVQCPGFGTSSVQRGTLDLITHFLLSSAKLEPVSAVT